MKVFVFLAIFALTVGLNLHQTDNAFNQDADEYLLFSDNTTSNGDWALSVERCPNGTYARGFNIKNENYQGPLDDTSMNGIRLFCGSSTFEPSVTSLHGDWGTWGETYFCEDPNYLNGFQLRAERSGALDNTAANNIRVYCSDDAFTPFEADGNTFGDWGEVHMCNKGYGVCGLKTQVEPDQGFLGDDTALNNLAFLCCRI